MLKIRLAGSHAQLTIITGLDYRFIKQQMKMMLLLLEKGATCVKLEHEYLCTQASWEGETL